MLEIEKQFKESIEKFEQKMAAFCNQLPISAKPTGESSTAIDLEIIEDDIKNKQQSNIKHKVSLFNLHLFLYEDKVFKILLKIRKIVENF